MKKKIQILNRELRKSGLKGKKLLQALELALLPKDVGGTRQAKEEAPKKKARQK